MKNSMTTTNSILITRFLLSKLFAWLDLRGRETIKALNYSGIHAIVNTIKCETEICFDNTNYRRNPKVFFLETSRFNNMTSCDEFLSLWNDTVSLGFLLLRDAVDTLGKLSPLAVPWRVHNGRN